MNRCLTLGLLLVCVACVFAQYPQYPRRKPPPPKEKLPVPEVDNKCMDCLCQASSNCDETIKCHNAGGGAYFCGPYVISWAYWHDGGRPGDKGRAHDFETCLNNKTCAEEAVRGYMRKYGQDCDRSGAIDCYDFARIHKLGFGSCSDEGIFNTDYYEKFEICYSGYEASYNNDANFNIGANYNNDGINNDGANINGGAEGVFVDYGDDHIQARDARMG